MLFKEAIRIKQGVFKKLKAQRKLQKTSKRAQSAKPRVAFEEESKGGHDDSEEEELLDYDILEKDASAMKN